MLSNSLRRATRTLPSARLFHASAITAAQTAPGKDPRQSQGTASQAGNRHSQDPHNQAARGGQRVASGEQSSGPHDAASRTVNESADRSGLSGNQEGVGFADQVGSASSTANKGTASGEGKGREEEATPEGLAATIKSKLGLGSSSGGAKQTRPFHTSVMRATASTVGQAPDASRVPKERTNGDQNPHLKHKSTQASPDKGKGNAGENPTLPSHQFDKNSSSGSQQKRAFSMSARRLEDQKHTAESYFKDVDTSPPASSKTHQVDGSGTGSQIRRPNEPMTGEFSRAGPESKEYETTTKNGQYDTPPDHGAESEQKGRYGNMSELDGSKSVSNKDEGPEGASKGGRKPEGRS
ncbi:hypothetical protein TRAPUB_7352 [Trametes pubescens]|uniref:Uncharacterized protein n=1 Tax=Trametes pubescens TaxID=154538 RepID=A0A1M2W6J5_TRAPU|nr:hypothetical protein TRAPUB_7352 [Trametes pubescens]